MVSTRKVSRWLRAVAIRSVAYPALAYQTAGAVFYLQQDKLLFPAPKTSRRADPSNGHSMVEGFRHQNERDGPSPRGWIPSVTASAKVILVSRGTVKWEDLVGNEVADLVGHVIGAEAVPGFSEPVGVGHKRMP